MADKITQHFGIEAQQALQALQALDAGFAKLEDRFRNLSNAVGGVNQAGRGLSNFGGKAKKDLDDAANSANRLTTSLQLLSRIVFTQAVVRGLSQIRSTFRETTQAAVEFQRQIAQTQIIDEAGRSFEQLADAARQLSDEANIPLQQTAEGFNQVIQNLGAEGAENFTRIAAEFAKATGSTLSESVDLLSGSIKAFGLETEDADRVAGSFLRTIDEGRIVASDLANSFGRVAAQGADLGLSLDEVNSAIALITQRAIEPSEALTQLRGIMNALIKPSEGMSEALARLGFSSGQAAVQTLGLTGLLQEISNLAQGNQDVLGQLFPNVRGLTGAIILQRDLEELSSSLEGFDEITRDYLGNEFGKVAATDAEQFTDAANRLSNVLVVDFGQALLRTTNSFVEFLGGAESLAGVFSNLGPALVGASTALGLLAVRMATVRAELALLSKGLLGLAAAAAAIGAGVSLGDFIAESIKEGATESLKELEALNKRDIEAFEKAQQEKIDASARAREEIVRNALQQIRPLNQAYKQDVANAAKTNEELVDNTERAIKEIVNSRRDALRELEKAAEDSLDIIRDSRDRVRELQQSLSDRKFERELEQSSSPEQLLEDRARALSQRGIQALLRATTDEQVRAAEQILEKSFELAERIEGTKGEDLQDSLIRRQIDAERQLQQIQAKRSTTLDQQATALKSQNDQVENLLKTIGEATSRFDAKGNPLSPEQIAANEKVLEDSLTQLFEITGGKAVTRLVSVIKDGSEQVQSNLQTAFENFKLNIPPQVFELAAQINGRPVTGPDDIIAALGLADEQATTSDKAIAEQAADAQRILDLQKEIQQARQEIQASPDKVFRQDAIDVGSDITRLATSMETLSQKVDLSAEDMRQLTEDVKSVEAAFTSLNSVNQGRLLGDVERLGEAAADLQALFELQQEIQGAAVDQAESARQLIDAFDPAGKLSAAQAPAQQVGNILQTAGVSAGDALIQRARIAAAILAAAQTGPQTAAFGGRFFQHGGRGPDTIPAMLRAGEFVINPRASQNFAAQLQAINANQTPVFRDKGGPVTNVGDINVNVTTDSTRGIDARQVAQQIRREIRRGSISSL